MKKNKIKDLVESIEKNPVELKGHVYHPIPFDEFNHLSLSSNKNAVLKKWNYIFNTVKLIFGQDLNKLNVLDVGANAGFYTFNFEKLGAKVTAYECHPRYSIIGEKLVELKNLKTKWIKEPFVPSSLNDSDHFNIGLLLSVYQWMAKGDINDKEAKESLMKISQGVDYLFFELGFNKGKSSVETNKWNHYAALIAFLQNNTTYSNFSLIARTKLWKGSKRFLILCSNDKKYNDTFITRLIRKLHF